jgi:hypothetical protein
MSITFPSSRLAPGSYYCGVSIGKGNNLTGLRDYDIVTETLFFEVTPEANELGTVGDWYPEWGAVCFESLSAAWVH